MLCLHLYLFGTPRIELNAEPIQIGRRKAAALLANLAVEGGRHSRDALATLFWPGYDQGQARAHLRRALASLNKRLGREWFVADRETVGLNLNADPSTGSGRTLWLDVDEFRHRLAACETHGHPLKEVCADCLPLLQEAIELYRDDFMAGFSLSDSLAFDDWQRFHTEELRLTLVSALERLVRGLNAHQTYDAALPHARRWLELDSTHEPAHRQLMALYAHTGQTSAALRQYRFCERTLSEGLGVPPSAETTALYQRIRDGEIATRGARSDRRHNLPATLTPLVGRERELSQLRERLRDPDCRLLTLVGPGGSGKTRLALEAAADAFSDGHDQDYTHGVFFVSLAPVKSPEEIVPTMAQALGFSFFSPRDRRGQLLSYLRQRRSLLVLDNLEHLLADPGAVDLVVDVLKAASGVKILVTSRARLSARGELIYPVYGMDVPEQDDSQDALKYGAVQLFLLSARRVNPAFEAAPDDLDPVVRICQLVRGMPLALLLAAAWVDLLSPAEIAQQLLDHGIDFLETDWRAVPARQRSMRAVFDHSWNLLTARQREIFAALSVFRGGFTRAAAEQVTGASLRQLKRLVHRSLLLPTPTGRYELHELVRQYAAEKLRGSPSALNAARDRHSAYYCAAVESWWADFQGPKQQETYIAFMTDRENVLLAWEWAAEQQHVERLDRATDGLNWMLQNSARYLVEEAACRLATSALAAGDAERPELGTASADRLRVWARILLNETWVNWQLGRAERAQQQLEQCQALLERSELADHDIRRERGGLLWIKSFFANVAGDRPEAQRLMAQSLAVCHALDARWETAHTLRFLGDVAVDMGQLDKAHPRYRESLRLFREMGCRGFIARLTTNLSRVATLTGRLAQAERLAREGSALYREIGLESGNQLHITAGFPSLALALRWQGRFTEALALHLELMANFEDLESRYRDDYSFTSQGVEHCFDMMHLGQYQEARDEAQLGLTFGREIGWREIIGHALWALGCVALAEGAHSDARRHLNECAGLYRDIEDREGLSRALAALAYEARSLGDWDQAGSYLGRALHIAREIGGFRPLIIALPAAALLLADQGELERGLELYALASHYPVVANSRWFDDVAGKHIAAVAAALPPSLAAAAKERGRSRNLQTTIIQLRDEFSTQRVNAQSAKGAMVPDNPRA